ncbi:hypothetical protein ABZS96_08655 [Streptomyces avermitilis]|uniref:hypothetical protein n=1 Tax=Streptomyces avermitilis TaxID=33903 RepID=UPI0033AABDDD
MTSLLVLRCRLVGRRFRFQSEGATMRWRCERGCGAHGSKRYPSAEDAERHARAVDHEDAERHARAVDHEDAERHARAFDHGDAEDLGRRAPLVGLFPLRLLRAVRLARARRAGSAPDDRPPAP